MEFAWTLGLRYLRSKKRAFISVGTLFAILGVALGVAALATVMSVTGGFHKQFRDKVLGVNAHVLILKRTPEFCEYRKRMDQVRSVPGVTGVGPFVINPMLVSAGERTATGVLMKGVDPELMPTVLDLPKHIVEGSFVGLRRRGAAPPKAPRGSLCFDERFDLGNPAPSTSASTGASAPSTANSADPLLAVMEKTVEARRLEDEEAAKVAASASAASSVAPSASTVGSAAAPAGPAPSANMEPSNGYDSKLPSDEEEEKHVNATNKDIEKEVADSDLAGVVIGKTLATNLKLKIGDRLRITSPAVGFFFTGNRTPTARQFRVIAIFEAGFDQYDSKLVYVDLFEAQQFYDQGDSVTGIEMRISDIDQAAKIKKIISEDVLKKDGRYHVMDWWDLNRPLFTALTIQQVLMSSVLALIIVVAAFTVIATLIMIVLDKRKEIAVLKAMGAHDAAILRAFLYQGLIIGMVGTLIGLTIGWVMCKLLLVYGFPLDPKVYFISRLPVEVRPKEFLLTGAIAIVICMVATIIPALHAARIRPAEGLRAQ